jgi:hypothetical protein
MRQYRDQLWFLLDISFFCTCVDVGIDDMLLQLVELLVVAWLHAKNMRFNYSMKKEQVEAMVTHHTFRLSNHIASLHDEYKKIILRQNSSNSLFYFMLSLIT